MHQQNELILFYPYHPKFKRRFQEAVQGLQYPQRIAFVAFNHGLAAMTGGVGDVKPDFHPGWDIK